MATYSFAVAIFVFAMYRQVSSQHAPLPSPWSRLAPVPAARTRCASYVRPIHPDDSSLSLRDTLLVLGLTQGGLDEAMRRARAYKSGELARFSRMSGGGGSSEASIETGGKPAPLESPLMTPPKGHDGPKGPSTGSVRHAPPPPLPGTPRP